MVPCLKPYVCKMYLASICECLHPYILNKMVDLRKGFLHRTWRQTRGRHQPTALQCWSWTCFEKMEVSSASMWLGCWSGWMFNKCAICRRPDHIRKKWSRIGADAGDSHWGIVIGGIELEQHEDQNFNHRELAMFKFCGSEGWYGGNPAWHGSAQVFR